MSTDSSLMEIYKKLTFSPAIREDIKRENANIDADTAMGTMLKYGSEGSKYFIDNYVLPEKIAKAHASGDIHIHDKDFYMLTETCCQIDLIKLFSRGFFTGHGFLREPQSIESYSALACIAIQANQNEMHGGQSVPNFDYAMARGVEKTYAKEYRKAFTFYLRALYNDTHNISDELYDNFIEITGINPIDALDETKRDSLWERIADCRLELYNRSYHKAHSFAVFEALKSTEQRVFQAMEALIHNLNTMNSRAGAQVPFSSLNYGTDTSVAGRMVVKNLLLATDAGLGNGETSIFPVQIFKVKEGVNYNPGDPNYDLFKLAMQVSAKRLFPNFSFLDASFNLVYYQNGNYDSEVAYMGCRTRVLGNVYDRSRQVTCGRGNLSFTSLNLPRLGMRAKGNADEFFALLDNQIDIVFEQLLHRLEVQSTKCVYNYPFLMGNGIWLDSDKLNWSDSVAEVLKHGTLTIGFIGLAECLKALIGVHHGESDDAQELGLKIIQHIRKRADAKCDETGLNFTVIATPAEGLSGRFVKLDRDLYGEIPGVTDRDYYTNSFHVPVYYPIKVFKKIQIEAPYHAMTNAGHITYVELDGDAAKNLEAFERIIRYMHDQGVGYGSVNHPVDRDPVCGYVGIIHDICPRCGRKEGEGVSLEKLKELNELYPGKIPAYF